MSAPGTGTSPRPKGGATAVHRRRLGKQLTEAQPLPGSIHRPRGWPAWAGECVLPAGGLLHPPSSLEATLIGLLVGRFPPTFRGSVCLVASAPTRLSYSLSDFGKVKCVFAY